MHPNARAGQSAPAPTKKFLLDGTVDLFIGYCSRRETHPDPDCQRAGARGARRARRLRLGAVARQSARSAGRGSPFCSVSDDAARAGDLCRLQFHPHRRALGALKLTGSRRKRQLPVQELGEGGQTCKEEEHNLRQTDPQATFNPGDVWMPPFTHGLKIGAGRAIGCGHVSGLWLRPDAD